MSVTIDPNNPIESLQSVGLSCQEVNTSSHSSMKLGKGLDIDLGNKSTVRYIWSIPGGTKVQGSFSHENLDTKVVKIFKKELQTGDKMFDDLVYIKTSDKDSMAQFLQSQQMRTIISDIIEDGGKIVIDRNQVVYEVTNGASPKQKFEMATVIATLAGLV